MPLARHSISPGACGIIAMKLSYTTHRVWLLTQGLSCLSISFFSVAPAT